MTIVSSVLSSSLTRTAVLDVAVVVSAVGVLFTAAALMLSAVGVPDDHPRMARTGMVFQVLSLVCALVGIVGVVAGTQPAEATMCVIGVGVVTMIVVVRCAVLLRFGLA
jgi:hypothetical protein